MMEVVIKDDASAGCENMCVNTLVSQFSHEEISMALTTIMQMSCDELAVEVAPFIDTTYYNYKPFLETPAVKESWSIIDELLENAAESLETEEQKRRVSK